MWSTWLAVIVRPSICALPAPRFLGEPCLLIDFQIADLHHDAQGGASLRVV